MKADLCLVSDPSDQAPIDDPQDVSDQQDCYGIYDVAHFHILPT